MAFKDSAKAFAKKFHLDSHHAIERFGVGAGVLAVSFVLVFGMASASALDNRATRLDETVLYTPTFTTSKTQLSGDVSGVFTNSDKTRAMVLMKFKDTSSMSTNAENYQSFVTGSAMDLSLEQLKTDVSGELVIFGTTGYMAVVIDSSEEFPQQIMNLTMRANSELVYTPGDSVQLRKDLEGQESFTQFDQWRIFFNPGASGVVKSQLLDSAEFDPGAIYAAMIVEPQEEEVRARIDNELGQMRADLTRIEEYQADMRRVNVDGVFLTPPAVPEQIADDEIVGEPAEGDKPSSLELDASWVSPAGFDFDWRDGSVTEGYLDDEVPEGESYVTFLADKAAAGKDSGSVAQILDQMEWKLSNGRLLDDYSTSDTAMKPLFDLRNNLTQAYQTYFDNKMTYQTKSLPELIEFEVDLRNVESGSSTNTTEDAVMPY